MSNLGLESLEQVVCAVKEAAERWNQNTLVTARKVESEIRFFFKKKPSLPKMVISKSKE